MEFTIHNYDKSNSVNYLRIGELDDGSTYCYVDSFEFCSEDHTISAVPSGLKPKQLLWFLQCHEDTLEAIQAEKYSNSEVFEKFVQSFNLIFCEALGFEIEFVGQKRTERKVWKENHPQKHFYYKNESKN